MHIQQIRPVLSDRLHRPLYRRHNLCWFVNDFPFDIKPGEHPIVPVMLYEAPLAQEFAASLLAEGIYVIGFFYPVVPQGQARIRVQLSAAHKREHLDRAIAAFTRVGKELGVLQ